jgi:hypothetical protein
LEGKPGRKTPLGRPWGRWVDNIKMDLRERGWGGMDWIDMAQDRVQWRTLVNTVMNLRVPQNAGKFLSNCIIGDFLSRAQLHEISWLLFLTVTGSERGETEPCPATIV